jgi:hypothetical protein
MGRNLEKKWSLRKKNSYWAAKAGQKSPVYRHVGPNELTKEGPLSNMPLESPIPSVLKSSTTKNSTLLSGVNIEKFMDVVASVLWPVWKQQSRQRNPDPDQEKQKGKMKQFYVSKSLIVLSRGLEASN